MPPHPHPRRFDAELAVRGALPPELSGRLTAVGDGMIHSLDLSGGGVTHLARPIRTPDVVSDLVAVDSSVLAYTDHPAVVELSPTGTSRRIDLAGVGQVPVTSPTLDPATGELHLVARSRGGGHAHVVVSAGRLTRRSRPIDHVPYAIAALVLSRDHVVVVADGAIGTLARSGPGPITWTPTETAAPPPVRADDTAGGVELLVLAPSLERWTVRPADAAVEREVLDVAPKRFARSSAAGDAPTSVWTAGGRAIARYDLRGSRTTERIVTPNAPGDFVLVPGAARSGTDHGWFVGLVHDSTERTTQVHLICTDDMAVQTIASFGLPRRLPLDARCTWTQHPPSSHPTDDDHHQECPS